MSGAEETEKTALVVLERQTGYHFEVQPGLPETYTFAMDEPPPLGQGRGPNAARVLAAAVGHCLSASLLFCLQKSRIEAGPVRTEVQVKIRRNERGRWRVAEMKADLYVKLRDSERESAFQRCVQIFEDYCIVSASVRQAIPLQVQVHRQD